MQKYKPWTSEQILLLKAHYTLSKTSLQALFPERSWVSITQKINNIGLKRKNQKWLVWEDEFLRTNYFATPTTDLAKYLGRTIPSIIQRAIVLNLTKSFSVYRNTSCNKLTDGSIESLYWIGFIFADGHISQNNRLKITLSIKDVSHLERFAKYVNSRVWITRFGKYDKCTVSIKDVDNIKNLKHQYQIHHQKTYNPPNPDLFNEFNSEQMMAFIIGFIDGDGSIRTLERKNSPFNIIIKNHASWLPIHSAFAKFLINYFDVESKMYPKILTSGYSQLNITHSNIVHGIKDFVTNYNLPVLGRKWDNITPQVRLRQKLSKSQIAEVITKFKTGTKIYHISKEYKVSFNVIKRIVSSYTEFE